MDATTADAGTGNVFEPGAASAPAGRTAAPEPATTADDRTPPPTDESIQRAVRGTAALVARQRMSVWPGRRPAPADGRAPGDADAGSDRVLFVRLAELRTAVAAYVARRRGQGAPVQRVLPEVKVLVREAIAHDVTAHEVEATLREQVVRWAIEAYYTPAGE